VIVFRRVISGGGVVSSERGRPRGGSKGAPQDGRPRRSDRPNPHRSGRWEERSDKRAPSRRSGSPDLPADISPADLDPQLRRDLRGLPKGLADEVAVRLLAAAQLLETDPEAAYGHAAEAARIASRVAATREALGVVAYATGRWAQARTELRAASRLSGSDEFLPMIADCERGLGRPDRALEIAKSPQAAALDRAGSVEMRIVASGARRDLGQLDAAVLVLQTPDLRAEREPWSARLRYAYADALFAAGRTDEAGEWFAKAAAVDHDGSTEAQDRVDELSGTTFMDLDPDDDPPGADDSEGADGTRAT
jgi:tetratricopeptide (TPR) repeat protein